MKAEKPCRGINKAKGFGCDTPSSNRNYGLCPKCKYLWATSTESGKAWFEKQMAYKKKKNKSEERKKNNKWKADTKIELMSIDKYRAKILQPNMNLIARLIDYGQPCIATENYGGKENGGHYFSVGSNRTICLNLHNIFLQSFESNHHKSGDGVRYRIGLINTFGNDYFEFIESLRRCPPLKNTKQELIEFNKLCLEIIKVLKSNKKVRTPGERVILRNEINIQLGIYPKQFCEYEPKN